VSRSSARHSGPTTANEADAAAPTRSGRRLPLDLHRQLRAKILSGELAPGAEILQAEMARAMGVSRTPMREAFRLLQEEGLIEAEPDQRARVHGFDAEDLDSVYAARISLESLAVTMTVPTISDEHLERLTSAIELMRLHIAEQRPDQWQAAHREFHRLMSAAVGPHLRRLLGSLGEHAERYIRLAQLGVADAWTRGQQDHEQLLAAALRRDDREAGRLIARHLARTALSVMADVAPEHEPAATRTALRLATQGG
jgi:DNA-binding GntR family transcriptional regulator